MHRLLPLIVAAGAATSANADSAGAAGGGHWFGNPLIEIVLGVLVAWFAAGLYAMLRRQHQQWPVGRARVGAFCAGVVVVALALLSPLDVLSDTFFSVHMAQHLLLVLCAAPLLALSNVHLVLLRAIPLPGRRAFGRAVARIPGVSQAAHKPVAAWVAAATFIGTLWFWHIPAAYDWALDNERVHSGEHIILLAAAVFFWRVVVTSGDRRLSPGMAIVLVSLVGIQGGFLSALIMFASHPLYPHYAANSLDDQILAGVLMCIPASFVYLGSTIWALSRMLGNERRHAR